MPVKAKARKRATKKASRPVSIAGRELPQLRGVPKTHSIGFNRRAGSSVEWVHVCSVGEFLSVMGRTVSKGRGKAR